MSSSPLTLQGFRVWLGKQSNRRRFRARNARCCPIAAYLKDTRQGRGKVSVTASTFYAPVKGSRMTTQHSMPVWGNRFVRAVDSCDDGNTLITVSKARELLLDAAYRRA